MIYRCHAGVCGFLPPPLSHPLVKIYFSLDGTKHQKYVYWTQNKLTKYGFYLLSVVISFEAVLKLNLVTNYYSYILHINNADY